MSRSAFFPTLNVGYNYSWYTKSDDHSQNGIELGMSVPMFGNKNNVKRAKAQQLYAEMEY